MTTSRFTYWTYSPTFTGLKDLVDPRISVAKHTGWFKTGTQETDFATPEPDNYNRGLLSTKPVECSLVEDQVAYYDSSKKLWITLFYVPEEDVDVIDQWIRSVNKLAVWVHLKAPRLKQRRCYLWTRDNKSKNTLTDNERLYTMGYYEDFKVKYFSDDPEYVDSLLGEARASLKNYVPEEHSEKVDDF